MRIGNRLVAPRQRLAAKVNGGPGPVTEGRSDVRDSRNHRRPRCHAKRAADPDRRDGFALRVGPRSIRSFHSALCRPGRRQAVLSGRGADAFAGGSVCVVRGDAACAAARVGDLRLLCGPQRATQGHDGCGHRRRPLHRRFRPAAVSRADRLDRHGPVSGVPARPRSFCRRRRRVLAHDRHGVGAGALARADVGRGRRRRVGGRRLARVARFLRGHARRATETSSPPGVGA